MALMRAIVKIELILVGFDFWLVQMFEMISANVKFNGNCMVEWIFDCDIAEHLGPDLNFTEINIFDG